MKTVKVGNIIIGEGKPKICVPIVERDIEGIVNAAGNIVQVSPDIVEWRVDFFDQIDSFEAVKEVLFNLRKILKEIPILFTFRIKCEGGNRDISFEDYSKLLIEASKMKDVDLIDVQTFFESSENIIKLVNKIKSNGTFVIGSYHNFDMTLPKNELLEKMKKMQKIGVDIVKTALMPNNKHDVIELLDATLTMKEKYSDRPLVTMSMGKDGVVSRICGECFGSDITFAAVGKTSAPGQIEAKDLKRILEVLD